MCDDEKKITRELSLREKLAPILWSKWKPDPNNPSSIIGEWAEDFSEFVITVPSQLRDTILLMQNWLADRFITLEELKKEVRTGLKFWKD